MKSIFYSVKWDSIGDVLTEFLCSAHGVTQIKIEPDPFDRKKWRINGEEEFKWLHQHPGGGKLEYIITALNVVGVDVTLQNVTNLRAIFEVEENHIQSFDEYISWRISYFFNPILRNMWSRAKYGNFDSIGRGSWEELYQTLNDERGTLFLLSTLRTEQFHDYFFMRKQVLNHGLYAFNRVMLMPTVLFLRKVDWWGSMPNTEQSKYLYPYCASSLWTLNTAPLELLQRTLSLMSDGPSKDHLQCLINISNSDYSAATQLCLEHISHVGKSDDDEVVHKWLWGFPNLHLECLARTGNDTELILKMAEYAKACTWNFDAATPAIHDKLQGMEFSRLVDCIAWLDINATLGLSITARAKLSAMINGHSQFSEDSLEIALAKHPRHRLKLSWMFSYV